MAYVLIVVNAVFIVSSAWALRPRRRGLFAALAQPIGWAAGELPGQGVLIELALVGILWWWGWPASHWLRVVVVVVVAVALLQDAALIAVLFYSRRVVRVALEVEAERPLVVPSPRDDAFGSWWRTVVKVSLHPRNMQIHENVVYGPAPRNVLDVWRLSTTPSGAPVILYLHGGAWTFGSKREQSRPMLHEFVARGWIVVACNYRLAPRDPWPAQIEDVIRVLGWIKKNIATYGGDPDRVVVAGTSAGGHLAAMLALGGDDPTWRPSDMADVLDWRVRGCLSFYGVLEMTGDEAHWRGLGRGIRFLLERRVVQRPIEGNEDVYRALSPYERIAPDSPPFFVAQGRNDTLVDVNVARDFVAKFRDVAFAPIYYVELPLTQHTYDLAASPRTSASTRAAVAFAESVTAPRPVLSPALRARYEVPPARLEVEVAPSDWRPARDAVTSMGPFVVVTSDNPFSRVFSDEENARRRTELRRQLDRRHLAWRATRASDALGDWPEEYGVALPGASLSDARALSLAWDQFAFYEVTDAGVVVHEAQSALSPLSSPGSR